MTNEEQEPRLEIRMDREMNQPDSEQQQRHVPLLLFSREHKLLGIVLAVISSLLIVFELSKAVFRISQSDQLSVFYVGFWLGFVLCISAILMIFASSKQHTGLLKAALITEVITIVLGIVGFALECYTLKLTYDSKSRTNKYDTTHSSSWKFDTFTGLASVQVVLCLATIVILCVHIAKYAYPDLFGRRSEASPDGAKSTYTAVNT